jgi:heme A synthase
MSRPNRFVLALLTAFCALAAMVTGAYVTSVSAIRTPAAPASETRALQAAPSAERPPVGASGNAKLWKNVHRGLSSLSGLAALALAFLLGGRMRAWLIASVLLASIPGGLLDGRIAPGLSGLIHAVTASIMTSVCFVAALYTSAAWASDAPDRILDEGSPSLATLARVTWVALLVQTALGALYRHQVLGLLPHVGGALLVMGLAMFAGIAAFSTAAAPPSVKRPALILLILTGVQMLFGLGAYLYRVEFQEQATGEAAMLTFTVIHVAVGALTTASCALMGMQITRYVRPATVAA